MNPEKIKQFVYKAARKVWAYCKIARMELIVFAALLVLDLVTKQIIEATMYEGETIVLIPNFLNFTFVYNELAAFGSAFGLENLIGPQAVRVIFIIITFIALGIFGYFLWRNRGKNKLCRASLAMILAGALGNLVDRLFIGKVRDFVEIVFFGCDVPLLGESFAIFNIADAALVVGVILFLIYFIFMYREPKDEDEEAAPDVELYENAEGGDDVQSSQTDGDDGDSAAPAPDPDGSDTPETAAAAAPTSDGAQVGSVPSAGGEAADMKPDERAGADGVPDEAAVGGEPR